MEELNNKMASRVSSKGRDRWKQPNLVPDRDGTREVEARRVEKQAKGGGAERWSIGSPYGIGSNTSSTTVALVDRSFSNFASSFISSLDVTDAYKLPGGRKICVMDSFPVVDMEKLLGGERRAATEILRDACENWGFFEILNHGISHDLMDEVEKVNKEQYNKCREQKFNEFANKALENVDSEIDHLDWESTFFLRHLPVSNISEIPDLDDQYRLHNLIMVSVIF
ncbi:hypothetical protein GW17_00018311 [Ensete ventricosum]|nr:hypothetical protein GW17_00018311 [Ensete ventricosum]